MYNFIKTCQIEFLREFFHSGCAYEAQKECAAEKGISVEVSEELASWMKENARWVTETWAAREQALLRPPSTIASNSATKRRVVRLVVLANGALAEEVSWE